MHLLRVADGRQLWTQIFDQPFTDIFEVQDTIATRIAKALSMQAPSAEMLARRHGTSDPEAYLLYTSGRFAFSRLTEATLLQAIDFYRQAVTRDPSYARAYASLADCYSLLGVIGASAPHETFPLARAAVDKALELDSQLASAYTARAQIHAVYDFDAHSALEDLNRAAELDPELSSIYFYRGVVYGCAGRQRAQPGGVPARSATGAGRARLAGRRSALTVLFASLRRGDRGAASHPRARRQLRAGARLPHSHAAREGRV